MSGSNGVALRRGDFFWRTEMTSGQPVDAVAYAAQQLHFKVSAMSVSGSGYYERKAHRDQKYVETCPILVPTRDGAAIVLASPQKNKGMIAFAQKIGAQYLPKYITVPVWWRLVDRPYQGKVYTAEQWLRDAGREYHRVWDGFNYLKKYQREYR